MMIGIAYVLGMLSCAALYWMHSKRSKVTAKPIQSEDPRSMEFSPAGFSVEVDCRACGKFNRIPGHRLRDRPLCGSCKTRLMPRHQLRLCRVTTLAKALSDELNTVWKDQDRLWEVLANHVLLEEKRRAEARNPTPVN